MGRRRPIARKDLIAELPDGHWSKQTAPVEKAPEFPPRKVGEPMVVVVNKAGTMSFMLDGAYQLLPGQPPADVVVQAQARHHTRRDGWLPAGAGQAPWWARKMGRESFVAYWIAD